jgi:phage tail-like protein
VSERGLSLCFTVTIEGLKGDTDLGNWVKCEGLTVEYDVFEYQEGGENSHVHRIPGRCKYANVKLTRPLNKHSSDVAAWVSGMQSEVQRYTAHIIVRDAARDPVAQWTLAGAFPVRWTAPQLDVSASQAATETLELAHNGFLPVGGG